MYRENREILPGLLAFLRSPLKGLDQKMEEYKSDEKVKILDEKIKKHDRRECFLIFSSKIFTFSSILLPCWLANTDARSANFESGANEH